MGVSLGTSAGAFASAGPLVEPAPSMAASAGGADLRLPTSTPHASRPGPATRCWFRELSITSWDAHPTAVTMDPTLAKTKLHRALQLTLRNRKLRLTIGASRLLSSLESLAAKAIAEELSACNSSRLAPDTPEQAAAVAMQSFESLLFEVQRIATVRARRGGQSGGGLMRSPKRTMVQGADIRMALRHLCPLWPFC